MGKKTAYFFPLILLCASMASAFTASAQTDEWKRNVTNMVVTLTTVEMLSLHVGQADRACSSQSKSARAAAHQLNSRLAGIEKRLLSLQSLVRARARVQLGDEFEAQHFQRVTLANQKLVDQVRSASASTPRLTKAACDSLLTEYLGRADELEDLAQGFESQPSLAR